MIKDFVEKLQNKGRLNLNNKLYLFDTRGNEDNYSPKLLKENVIELGNNFFQTNDGKYNVFSDGFSTGSQIGLIKGDGKILYESEYSNSNVYYGVLDIKDIKQILYYVNNVTIDSNSDKNNEQKKLVYISTDNKIVTLDKYGKKEFDYNINNLGKVYEFVTAKNLVERD